jgi:hypothetical protein
MSKMKSVTVPLLTRSIDLKRPSHQDLAVSAGIDFGGTLETAGWVTVGWVAMAAYDEGAY